MTNPRGLVAPFDDAHGIWLRCAFHLHTTESDGWLQPATQRSFRAMQGYDVMAITDHDRLTPEPEGDDNLLIVSGTEITLTAPNTQHPLHLIGIGITEMPEVAPTTCLKEAALAVRGAGGLPYLAHPVWSGLHVEEVDGIEECAGIEVYNGSCEVTQGRGHAGPHWDAWLTMGHRLFGIGTDDTHYPGWEGFQAWTMVKATAKTREAVMEALGKGCFYASTGPRINEVNVAAEEIRIACSPVQSITAFANPHFGARVEAGRFGIYYDGQPLKREQIHAFESFAEGDLLTGATFTNHPDVRYVRFMITDKNGQHAWSNPVWFD